MRVVNLMAQHALAFTRLEAELDDDAMVIRLDFGGREPLPASLEKLRSFVEVSAVQLVEQREGAGVD
jgi:hypothetical protein